MILVTGISPLVGIRGVSVTSSVRRAAVASPLAYSLFRAAARYAPMLMPTDVSNALETTTGNPASLEIFRALFMPPKGAALRTSRSAA